MTPAELPALVAGVDYGSDSVRVTVLDAVTGDTAIRVSRVYPRWARGEYCDAKSNRFRQHPLDYIETLEACFAEIADRLGDNAVSAIAIDATGSTPAPVDQHGVPLAMHPEFQDDPDAMFWLWKDRTSTHEAELVDAALSAADPDHTLYQGVYSSEWWWAKILHGVTSNQAIRTQAHSWVEHSDWLPNMLAGVTDVALFTRNACAAGHKVLYNERLGGMVSPEVLASIDQYLVQIHSTFQTPPAPGGTAIGTLSREWAARLRLSTDTVIGVGSLDAHAGGVGAGIDDRSLVKVMGTSTVDLFLTDYNAIRSKEIRELCGIAEDSIVPGHLGGETGQAAFGDLFAWYARILLWPVQHLIEPELAALLNADDAATVISRAAGSLLSSLETQVAGRLPGDVVAVDWINGRRYPNPDETATASLSGLRIGHDAVDIYRALVEAAVLGSKVIYDGLADAGIRFERVILVGGIARKSPFICQSIADALGTEVVVSAEPEVCAAGSAMYAATAAGYFATIPDAQQRLAGGFASRYTPEPSNVERLNRAYQRYLAAGSFSAAAAVPSTGPLLASRVLDQEEEHALT